MELVSLRTAVLWVVTICGFSCYSYAGNITHHELNLIVLRRGRTRTKNDRNYKDNEGDVSELAILVCEKQASWGDLVRPDRLEEVIGTLRE